MIASYSNHSRTYIFMTEIDLQIQSFIIEQWDRTFREWLSHAQTSSRVFATWVVNPSIFSSFFLVGGLGEITCKKQTWSNAKAFRVIDRAADVLQIGQVRPFQAFVFLSLRTCCPCLGKISNGHACEPRTFCWCSINVVKLEHS